MPEDGTKGIRAWEKALAIFPSGLTLAPVSEPLGARRTHVTHEEGAILTLKRKVLSAMVALAAIVAVAAVTTSASAGTTASGKDVSADFTTQGGVAPAFLANARTIPLWTMCRPHSSNATPPIRSRRTRLPISVRFSGFEPKGQATANRRSINPFIRLRKCGVQVSVHCAG